VAVALQDLGDRSDQTEAHRRWIASNSGPVDQVTNGLEAELGQPVFRNDQAGRAGIILLTGIAGSNGAARNDGPQRFEPGDAGVRPDAFVTADGERLALALWDLDGNYFVVEAPTLPCCSSTLVTSYRELVGLVPGQAEFAGEIFGRLDHARDLSESPFGLRALPAAIEAIMQGRRTRTPPPADVARIVLDIAHALDTAGQDYVGDANVPMGVLSGPTMAARLIRAKTLPDLPNVQQLQKKYNINRI